MRFAIFGDIHGNIDALTAVYDSVMKQKVDRVYHLGDLGGYAPFVNEVAEFPATHGIEGVQGNYDENVALNSEHCGCKYEDPVQSGLADRSFVWTKQHADNRAREIMASLPKTLTFTSHGRVVALFHASPRKHNLYWYEDRPDKFFREMAEKIRADVLIFGHTHKPFRKDLDGSIFINAGSVGKPKDGDPRACFALIEITENRVLSEFPRVPYNINGTATAIIEKGLPPDFAGQLRQGK
ncbi:MAG: metallophosphatase family protein [Nitrospirota bacterium]|nr:metallophosphatase family protein [Nitrospirota bacterium]